MTTNQSPYLTQATTDTQPDAAPSVSQTTPSDPADTTHAAAPTPDDDAPTPGNDQSRTAHRDELRKRTRRPGTA